MTEWTDRLAVRYLLVALCIFASSILTAGAVRADEPVPITHEGETQLRFHVRAFIERGTALDPETVARERDDALPHPVSPPNFGRTNQPAWGYVRVVNKVQERDWMLRYTLGTVEDIRVFVRAAGETSFRQLHEVGENAKWPFSGYRAATFLLMLEPGAPVEIVTRLHTRAPIGFPLTISSSTNFFETDRGLIASATLLSAVPLVVVVYLTILAGVLRHNGLSSLIVMLLTRLVLDAWVTGFGQLVLPFIPRAMWPTFGFLMVALFDVACVLHIRRYLDLPRTVPPLDKALLLSISLFVALVAIEISGLANARFLLQLFAPLMLAALLAISVRFAWRAPGIGTVCYALAWCFFLSGAILLMLQLLTLIPFTTHTLTFSQSAVASLLFGVAIFRRIKDRDQALNRSLAEGNERFQLAIDGSAAAIYEYAPHAQFYAPRLAELVAAPKGSSLPRLLAKMSRETRKQLIGDLRRAIGDHSRHFRAEVTRVAESDAPVRHFTVTGAIQYDDSGALQRICGSVIDVSSERALAVEQQLAAALASEKERAERLLAARTIFYAAANHDLRHPLLSLGLYLQMLAKDRTQARLDSFLPRMMEAHRAAFGYVDLILDLARSDTNEIAVSLEMQELQPIFSRLVDRYQADAAQAGISLRCVPTGNFVLTDAFLLERILSNLLSNAIRNTGKGGVLLGCRRMHDGIRIDVIDTGPGIPPEIYQRITHDGLNGAIVHGSGAVQLGLIIVQRTARELGCSIDMATWPGKGTRFSVVIK